MFDLCEKYAAPRFSPFLDGGAAAVIEDEGLLRGDNVTLFGGYDGAERKMFGVFPEWQERAETDFPISVLRFDAPKFRTLTHRDYLGTLMSLGIDRGKTGDILTDNSGAYVFVSEDIAEYVLQNVNKIANIGVKGHKLSIRDFTAPEKKTQERACVSASLRLDAVIAAALNISRSNAENLIKEGRVKVNHRETSDRSGLLREGDLISVRGAGRFVLKEVGKATQKGRIHILIEKYI